MLLNSGLSVPGRTCDMSADALLNSGLVTQLLQQILGSIPALARTLAAQFLPVSAPAAVVKVNEYLVAVHKVIPHLMCCC